MKNCKNYNWLILLFFTFFFVSCNSEEDVMPRESPSFIKIMPGLGFEDVPVKVFSLNEAGSLSGFLIVSNTTFFVDGANISKIRMTRLSGRGEILKDSYFPSVSNESWSAVDVHMATEDEIVIAGNAGSSTAAKLLFFKTNAAGDSLRSITKSIENTSLHLVGIDKEADTDLLLFIASINSGANNTMVGAINAATLALQWSTVESVRAVPTTSIISTGNQSFSWGFKANNNAELAKTDTSFMQAESTFLQFPSASETTAKSLFNQDNENGFSVFGEATINGIRKFFYHNTLNNNFQQFGKASSNNTLQKVNKIDDGYLVLGNAEIANLENNTFQQDFLLIKTNESGFPQFTRSFGTNDNEELFDAVIANESIYSVGVTVFGDRNSMVFIKTNLRGELKNE